YPRAVHGAGRGIDAAAPAAAGSAEAVSDVALSGAGARRPAGVDLPLRDDPARGDPVRRRRARPGVRGLSRLVVADRSLAVRGRARGVVTLDQAAASARVMQPNFHSGTMTPLSRICGALLLL